MDVTKKEDSALDCATCPGNRNCISIPSMTKEEVEEATRIPKPDEEGGIEGTQTDHMVGALLAMLAFSGKDVECPCCPKFIERLRSGPELAAKIKEFMQSL